MLEIAEGLSTMRVALLLDRGCKLCLLALSILAKSEMSEMGPDCFVSRDTILTLVWISSAQPLYMHSVEVHSSQRPCEDLGLRP